MGKPNSWISSINGVDTAKAANEKDAGMEEVEATT
jgi:hypothetical protein